MALNSSSSTADTQQSQNVADITIPTQLKFLLTNFKNVVNIQLTPENHSLWRAQVVKFFTATGFLGYLDGSVTKPPSQSLTSENNSYGTWILTDQTLASALFSTISAPLLPYVIYLETCNEVWTTLDRRLQSTNRSRILQLKNELQKLKMKDNNITQFLSEIKQRVDIIQAAGYNVDTEDIILYTLNGLPPAYNSFKTSIRTKLHPISLDDLYALLCSEEANIKADNSYEVATGDQTDSTFALNTVRGRGRGRSRGRYPFRGGRVSPQAGRGGGRKPVSNVECQICYKTGHTAASCWHRGNFSYQPVQPQAYLTHEDPPAADWFLDTGASNHLTSDVNQMQTAQPYYGNSQVQVGSGQQLPIVQTGHGLLPTPSRTAALEKESLHSGWCRIQRTSQETTSPSDSLKHSSHSRHCQRHCSSRRTQHSSKI